MIYFIQEENNIKAPIKIGTSRNIKKRLNELQANSPVKLKVLSTIGGGRREESKLHRIFKKYRMYNEWFRPEDELIKYIFGTKYIPYEYRIIDKLIIGNLYYTSFDGKSIKQVRLIDILDNDKVKIEVIKEGFVKNNFKIYEVHKSEIQKDLRIALKYSVIEGDKDEK